MSRTVHDLDITRDACLPACLPVSLRVTHCILSNIQVPANLSTGHSLHLVEDPGACQSVYRSLTVSCRRSRSCRSWSCSCGSCPARATCADGSRPPLCLKFSYEYRMSTELHTIPMSDIDRESSSRRHQKAILRSNTRTSISAWYGYDQRKIKITTIGTTSISIFDTSKTIVQYLYHPQKKYGDVRRWEGKTRSIRYIECSIFRSTNSIRFPTPLLLRWIDY